MIDERLNADSREHVCTVNLAKQKHPWHGWQWFSDLNISKNEARLRKSAIDIKIDEEDILSLYERLIKGLKKRSKELDVSRNKISRVEEILRKIRERAVSAAPGSERDSLVAISKMTDSALKRLL